MSLVVGVDRDGLRSDRWMVVVTGLVFLAEDLLRLIGTRSTGRAGARKVWRKAGGRVGHAEVEPATAARR